MKDFYSNYKGLVMKSACLFKNLKEDSKDEISTMTIPPHFIDEKNKEVVFNLKGGYPVTMTIPTWIKSFPDNFKGITCRCEETFYKLRAKVND